MITSFNQNLFNSYGLRMITEFSENSDGTIKLIVAYEGETLPNINLPYIEFIYLNHPIHKEFLRRFAHLHEASGLRIDYLPNNKVNLYRDFRYDAIRFSFKIFSLLQTIEKYGDTEYFAWIDADVRCLRNFSATNLTRFFPNRTQLMSYLGRDNFPPSGAYSECGFLGFNNKHPSLMDFLNRIAHIYMNGEIFSFEQWHDSWIWDRVRQEFELQNVEFKNISGLASTTEHPFINSDLGLFFDHLKGPERKKMGSSFPADFKFRSTTK